MPPRLLPDVPFPPYAFVPGRSPHPVSDPAGHSFGHHDEPHPPFDSADWRGLMPFLRGLDLFNHGYYWEAHEAFETLWHAAGRKGPTADLLKGLIRLCACGVKVREGRLDGARGHAKGASDLFARAAAGLPTGRHLGLDVGELIALARGLTAFTAGPPEEPAVRVVFDFVLVPQGGTVGGHLPPVAD